MIRTHHIIRAAVLIQRHSIMKICQKQTMTSELKQLSLLWRHCRTAEKHIQWAHFRQLCLPVKGCRLTENVTSELISDSCAYLWKVVGWQKMWPVSSFLTAVPTCEREVGLTRGSDQWVSSFQTAVPTYEGWQRTVTGEFISDSCAYLWKGCRLTETVRQMCLELCEGWLSEDWQVSSFRHLCLPVKGNSELILDSCAYLWKVVGWQRIVTSKLISDSCAYLWKRGRLTEDCDEWAISDSCTYLWKRSRTAEDRDQWAPASQKWTLGRIWAGVMSSGELGKVEGVESLGDRLEAELWVEMELGRRSEQSEAEKSYCTLLNTRSSGCRWFYWFREWSFCHPLFTFKVVVSASSPFGWGKNGGLVCYVFIYSTETQIPVEIPTYFRNKL